MAGINYLYLIFGLLPSVVWLIFYLKKDTHPESSRMILKIFFYGMLSALPAIFLEFSAQGMMKDLNLTPVMFSFFYLFFGVALVEESLKYLVVKEKVLNNQAFDEPVDAMIYMIISALGFAASENILIFFSKAPYFSFQEIVEISNFRLLSATFLHALVSGLIGYFIALSILQTKNRGKLVFLGLGISTFLHGLYNFSIMEIEGNLKIIIPVTILIGLAIFISYAFQKVKKMANICKLNR